MRVSSTLDLRSNDGAASRKFFNRGPLRVHRTAHVFAPSPRIQASGRMRQGSRMEPVGRTRLAENARMSAIRALPAAWQSLLGCVSLGRTGGVMAGRRKMSKREFARKFADIAEEALEKLPPAEQDKKIARFENTVAKLSRETPSRASRTARIPAIPLHSRARG